MCDFFEGRPADISWYPPSTDEHKKKLGEFFGTTAAPPKNAERVAKAVREIEGSVKKFDSWGVVGYCWGGKVRCRVSCGARGWLVMRSGRYLRSFSSLVALDHDHDLRVVLCEWIS